MVTRRSRSSTQSSRRSRKDVSQRATADARTSPRNTRRHPFSESVLAQPSDAKQRTSKASSSKTSSYATRTHTLSASAASTQTTPASTKLASTTSPYAKPTSVTATQTKLAPTTSSEAHPNDQLEVTRLGDIRRSSERKQRRERMQQARKRYRRRIVVIVIVIAVVAVVGVGLRFSNAFAIKNVEVVGVTHLTSAEMAQMANVPGDSTLLRVDTDAIRNRLLQNAWVRDVHINRVFPDTLEIDVTERSIAAVVEVQNESGAGVKSWAISSDHMWLMPIPEKGSEAAKTTSKQIYDDADAALHITDAPYGTEAEIGTECVDDNVNNALDIISGLTTDLAGMVVSVSAAGPAETTLILDNGVEIAFGLAENIRDKERVVLKIMADNPDGVAYINVRTVENPTWREV